VGSSIARMHMYGTHSTTWVPNILVDERGFRRGFSVRHMTTRHGDGQGGLVAVVQGPSGTDEETHLTAFRGCGDDPHVDVGAVPVGGFPLPTSSLSSSSSSTCVRTFSPCRQHHAWRWQSTFCDTGLAKEWGDGVGVWIEIRFGIEILCVQ
jgi:hypothetical protein